MYQVSVMRGPRFTVFGCAGQTVTQFWAIMIVWVRGCNTQCVCGIV